MTPEDVDALKMPDLKVKCKELGLSTVGVKADLVARVKAALAAPEVVEEEEEEVKEPVAADADAGAVAGTATAAAAEPADPPPAAVFSGKHKPISFDEALLKKDDTVKLEVVHVAPAEPAAAPAEGSAPALSAEERLQKRAERFQDPQVSKLKDRAQRFGLSHPEIDKEKAIQRAVKFGLLHPALEEEKKKKRAERFGIVDEDTKKKQRQDKFKPLTTTTAVAATAPAAGAKAGGLTFTVAGADGTDYEAKKNARALRFAAS